MNKSYLIETACALKKVQIEAVKEYVDKREFMVGRVNELMVQRSDLFMLIGDDNLEMMKDNHSNHHQFMSSVFEFPNVEVFVETILWVFRTYRSHGFQDSYWTAQLNSWLVVIKQYLSTQAYDQISPYYEWMQINIPLFARISSTNKNTKTMH
jgi:hypothetical protein